MDYKNFPIFRGITPEIEEYLVRFDTLIEKNRLNLPPEEILMRKVYLFSDYLYEKNKKNNSEFTKNIENSLQRQAGKHGGVSLFLLSRGVYGNRRKINNDKKMSDNEYYGLIEAWKSENNSLKVSLGDGLVASGWVYKTSPNYSSKQDMHRFILNVDPNQTLLKELDKFALKYNCQYKCAETQHTAYSRPDTIVIYTADKRLEEQKQILASLVKPYVRANGNNLLDGDKIADGLFYATEKSRADIQNLINESKNVYPRLGEYLQSILNSKEKSHPLSLGEFTIFKDMLDSVKMLKNTDNTHSRENVSVKLSSNKLHTMQTILEEGIQTKFIKTPDLKANMPEIQKTTHVSYKINSQNPNQLIAQGVDENGKHTFCFRYDRSDKTYVYQGGNPEKTYSNDVHLNFSPLAQDVVSLMKSNRLMSVNKAFIEAEMRNGIEVTEDNYLYSIKQVKSKQNEDLFVFEKKYKNGLPLSKFILNASNNEYLAFLHETKAYFSNSAKFSDKKLPQLPQNTVNHIIQKYKQRIQIAEKTIMSNTATPNLQQKQRQ